MDLALTGEQGGPGASSLTAGLVIEALCADGQGIRRDQEPPAVHLGAAHRGADGAGGTGNGARLPHPSTRKISELVVMDSEPAAALTWGTDIRRRRAGLPFRCYEPRRHHVADLLLDALRWDRRTHLAQGDRRLTFADVQARIATTAVRFAAAGVRPGDRILLLAGNSPEWVIAMWAAAVSGAVAALGNTWWSAEEIAHAVALVTPRLVVCDEGRRERLPASFPASQSVDVGVLREWAAEPEPRPAVPLSAEDDPALIVFTAGTTGPPKAVTLAHRSVISNLHGLLAGAGRLPHQIDPDRQGAVVLQSGPLFHIGGLQSLLLAVVAGSTVVFLDGRFDPGQVLDLIEAERVTVWGGVPTMASRVLDHPSLPGRDLASVRSITLGGSRVPPELLERMRAAFPRARRGMSTIYGMTESGGTVASASGELMAASPETSGPPGPVVDMRIGAPDESGTGEILVRTPAQMIGYWSAAASGPETAGPASPVTPEGWLRTGDLGSLRDGLLYVTGRSKDIVIRGGENIAAAHVETVLTRHPDVLSAAVIGLPDADLGERVAAAVQMRPGSLTTAGDLAAFVTRGLARFEVPADWLLLTEPLPATDVGKTDKQALRERWNVLLARSAGPSAG
jgi:long-chain acyl-CoA synthetase